MATTSGSAEEGLELLDVGVGIFDSDLRLLFCNSAFRSLRQYPDDLCCDGVSLRALLLFNAERGDFGPGVANEQVAERLDEIITPGERQLEQEMANGQILQIRYRRNSAGGVVITYQDCTVERNAVRALEASEERYLLVSEATSDGIYDWNVSDDTLFLSDNLLKILDFSVKDFGGLNTRLSLSSPSMVSFCEEPFLLPFAVISCFALESTGSTVG